MTLTQDQREGLCEQALEDNLELQELNLPGRDQFTQCFFDSQANIYWLMDDTSTSFEGIRADFMGTPIHNYENWRALNPEANFSEYLDNVQVIVDHIDPATWSVDGMYVSNHYSYGLTDEQLAEIGPIFGLKDQETEAVLAQFNDVADSINESFGVPVKVMTPQERLVSGTEENQGIRVQVNSTITDLNAMSDAALTIEQELSLYPPGMIDSRAGSGALDFAGINLVGDEYFSDLSSGKRILTRAGSYHLGTDEITFPINQQGVNQGAFHHEFYHALNDLNGGLTLNDRAFALVHSEGNLSSDFYPGHPNDFHLNGGIDSPDHVSPYGSTAPYEAQAEIARRLFTDYDALMEQATQSEGLAGAIDFVKAEYFALSEGRMDERFWDDLASGNITNGAEYWAQREAEGEFIAPSGGEELLALFQNGSDLEDMFRQNNDANHFNQYQRNFWQRRREIVNTLPEVREIISNLTPENIHYLGQRGQGFDGLIWVTHQLDNPEERRENPEAYFNSDRASEVSEVTLELLSVTPEAAIILAQQSGRASNPLDHAIEYSLYDQDFQSRLLPELEAALGYIPQEYEPGAEYIRMGQTKIRESLTLAGYAVSWPEEAPVGSAGR